VYIGREIETLEEEDSLSEKLGDISTGKIKLYKL